MQNATNSKFYTTKDLPTKNNIETNKNAGWYVQYIHYFLIWCAMWTCDVIPWVSWWTIAFISGIYSKLVWSIASFDKKTLQLLLQGNMTQARQRVNWWFLLSLFWWIFIAIASLAKAIHWWLATYPSYVRSFFLWLLVISSLVLARKNKTCNMHARSTYAVWIFLWIILTWLSQVSLEPSILSTFFAWMIWICAMILPWVSWSYILLMFNHYHYILASVVEFLSTWQWRQTLVVFIAWACIWLLSFAKFLQWLLKKYYTSVILILAWFIVWSLHTLRPWKIVTETYTNRHGEILPLAYAKTLPSSLNEFFICLVIFLLWVWIVYGIEKVFSTKSSQ